MVRVSSSSQTAAYVTNMHPTRYIDLASQKPGTRVKAMCEGVIGEWLKLAGDDHLLKWCWVNLETGQVLHYSHLMYAQK